MPAGPSLTGIAPVRVRAPAESVRRDEARRDAGATGRPSPRRSSSPRRRARKARSATAPRSRALRRRRDGSSTRRVSAKPATVASSHGITVCAGGTPSTDSATSRGDPSTASATSARAAAASDSGADPNRRVARELELADAAIDQLALRRPGAQDHRAGRRSATAASAAPALPRPAIRRPRSRSARITIAAPAAIETSVAPESCVAKPSTGAACAMSSALPAATLARVVDQRDRADEVRSRQRVRRSRRPARPLR